MTPHDRHRQNYTPDPERTDPPGWLQALGLLLAALFVYLIAVFFLSL